MKKLVLSAAAGLSAAVALAGLYGDIPDAKHAWAVHDFNRPKPAKVEVNGKGIPSDAIVLFDGTKESYEKNWRNEKGGAPGWALSSEGYFYSKPNWQNGGGLFTRRDFGDCQLHIEYRHDPQQIFTDKGPQMRGNSGVFLMGPAYGYEVQVLESYYTSKDLAGKDGYVDNYTDGQAGSVYAENPPMVNPANKPGEWQVYDIVFHQPVWEGDKMIHAGSMTVFFNGVLVQDHWELEGETTHCRRRPCKPHALTGPLHLQDHGCVVCFRNVWIREIPSRWANTTHSILSAKESDVLALRKRTAADLFAKVDASEDNFWRIPQLMEVIAYDRDAKYVAALDKTGRAYAEKLNALKAAKNRDGLEAEKGVVLAVRNAYNVLARGGIEPPQPLMNAVWSTCNEQNWK